MYYEWTKHIELDCHFVHEKIQENIICTRQVKIGKLLGYVFIKALNGPQIGISL